LPLEPLVTSKWLQKNLADVVVLDGSYFLPTMNKDADQEFEIGHIPGAMRWNIDEIATAHPELNHMMPDPAQVAREAGLRGIHPETPVVVYDQLGLFSSARVWLTLRSAGHKQVGLLNGGLPAWRGDLASGPEVRPDPVEYPAAGGVASTVDRETVLAALEEASSQVVDARSAERFAGTAAEPRAGLLGGHMPSSISLPYTELLDENGLMKSRVALRAVFHEHQVDLEQPIITSCGSGVTASIISFALFLLGAQSLVYDGSWSEWGRPELRMPIVSSAT